MRELQTDLFPSVQDAACFRLVDLTLLPSFLFNVFSVQRLFCSTSLLKDHLNSPRARSSPCMEFPLHGVPLAWSSLGMGATLI